MTGTEIIGVKVCRACGQEKILTEFNRDRRALDGRRTQCRDCERAAAWRKTRRRRPPVPSEKNNARHALHRAVRDGVVVPPDRCAHCGKVGPVEGHHNDYSRPLEVSWLCRQCHQYLETLEFENHRLRLQLAQTERELRIKTQEWLIQEAAGEKAERDLATAREALMDIAGYGISPNDGYPVVSADVVKKAHAALHSLDGEKT